MSTAAWHRSDEHRLLTFARNLVTRYALIVVNAAIGPVKSRFAGKLELADVVAPEEYGIRAVHHPQRPTELTVVLEREGVLGQTDPLVPKPHLDRDGGDFGLTALRSKVLALGGDAADNPFWRFGAAMLGPVFSAFASWLVEQAEAEGESTVYCVMREGAIVNMSSISGKVGLVGQTNYSAAKAGIVGMTKASAKELAHLGVRVNAIQPGLIQTPTAAMATTTAPSARRAPL